MKNATNPRLSRPQQRAQLDLLQSLNRERLARAGVNPQVEGLIGSFELGFRMQAEASALLDLSKEGEAMKKLYGIGEEPTDFMGRQCLFEDALVIWGGEFGRTPHGQGDGRDHNAKGFSLWMAGGGVKGGIACGATDEYGYAAVENPVHIHDWHATILHLLGLDHERLTDVKGKVVKGILA